MTEPTSSGEKTYSQKEFDIERANAQKLKQELEELHSKFKGIDPDEVSRLKKEIGELKTKGAIGDEEKIKQRIAEETADIEKRLNSAYVEEKTKRESLEQELKRERVTKQIIQKASSSFTADGLELLTQVFERDGDWYEGKIVFKDAGGKPRYSPKDATKFLSEDEYIEELKSKYPSAALSTQQAGVKSTTQKINASSSNGFLTAAQIQALPDKGASYFSELSRTPEGYKYLETLVNNIPNKS